MRKYNKAYKQWLGLSLSEIHPLSLSEGETYDDHRHICAQFGCGRELKPVEDLAGPYCTHHMKRLANDPTKTIKL